MQRRKPPDVHLNILLMMTRGRQRAAEGKDADERVRGGVNVRYPDILMNSTVPAVSISLHSLKHTTTHTHTHTHTHTPSDTHMRTHHHTHIMTHISQPRAFCPFCYVSLPAWSRGESDIARRRDIGE